LLALLIAVFPNFRLFFFSLGSEGKGCQLGGCKEGGKKDSEGKKNFWDFVFPPKAVAISLIFGFSYVFWYFLFFHFLFFGNFGVFLATVANFFIYIYIFLSLYLSMFLGIGCQSCQHFFPSIAKNDKNLNKPCSCLVFLHFFLKKNVKKT